MGRPRKRSTGESQLKETPRKKPTREPENEVKEEEEEELELEEEELEESQISSSKQEKEGLVTLLTAKRPNETKKAKADADLSFIGSPIPAAEARQKWPLRYGSQNGKIRSATQNSNGVLSNEEEVTPAKCHYKQAMVDGILYNLGDNAYVKAEDGVPDYIARIVELFESKDGEAWFSAQWFYRAEDTVIKDYANQKESRRVFLSEIKNDNPLDCIVSNVKIALVEPNMDLAEKEKNLPPCDLYYDMKYTLPFLTFETIKKDDSNRDSGSSSICNENDSNASINDVNTSTANPSSAISKVHRSDMYLLDLYSGCGGMSTGLCMGAALSGVNLITKWAVDLNSYACKSLKANHPETEVRNEEAQDFLSLLKEWEKLCNKYILSEEEEVEDKKVEDVEDKGDDMEDEEVEDKSDDDGGEIFEVERLLGVCYGDPNKIKKRDLYFKVRWKGYGPSEDTWEPIEGMSDCEEKLKDFVEKGYKSKLLPLPGDADFICGGPPCQGISGFNRFRNYKAPLDDPKNHQMVVYMDIVEYLKPKYVLMENVVDILKFAGGFLVRYALGRLVSMNYQGRLGMMAAGSYGLPQFRMRVFMWGCQPSESLPQYPLPTHEVVVKGGTPSEFEEITVAYDKLDQCQLEKALYLGDAISDLPEVENDESQDERKYGTTPQSEFQKYIRLKKSDVVGLATAQNKSLPQMLYDHRPLKLNDDDYHRVCQIPKKKGANFRDLPGVSVNADNRVFWTPDVPRVLLPSGKPLVPDYAMSFVKGRSPKPFGRLWWDSTIPTVVTRAEPHNQAIIHPSQDRVLTIRENARIQGFPDCYQLHGPIKERYIQVGNAVAVPVATGLGYTFGLASQGMSDDKPLTTLPFKFPSCLQNSPSEASD
ncbi:putative DNA (cytosine-5)-methyltransferase CMT1 [Mercurialis annua]|uniref:putative DNA (cytosine-5)-methyltransferase CMT1 n=1 Tax=Mercurialis annua TaxID=3986 RepID=UPI00215F3119|nr:putative DNA (cytosine-5)-methyltransferase CMT1 [Mercurialis annua]